MIWDQKSQLFLGALQLLQSYTCSEMAVSRGGLVLVAKTTGPGSQTASEPLPGNLLQESCLSPAHTHRLDIHQRSIQQASRKPNGNVLE